MKIDENARSYHSDTELRCTLGDSGTAPSPVHSPPHSDRNKGTYSPSRKTPGSMGYHNHCHGNQQYRSSRLKKKIGLETSSTCIRKDYKFYTHIFKSQWDKNTIKKNVQLENKLEILGLIPLQNALTGTK